MTIAINPLQVNTPTHHEFKVGKPAHDYWADKRAELRRKRAEERRKVEAQRRQVEAQRRQVELKRQQAQLKRLQAQKRQLNVTATFYQAFCAEGCTGKTATGIDVSKTQFVGGRRIIAVDPALIPLGTTGVLHLANGQSFAVIAADTGGGIKGTKIDVLVANEREANELGVQSAVLTID